MTNYPINITFNVSGDGELRAISKTLQLMRKESSSATEGINTLIKELNNVNSEGFNSIGKEIQTFAKSINEVRGDQLKTINTEIKNIAKSSSETANSLQKMNFNQLENSAGRIKSIDASLKSLLSTIEKITSEGNIRLKITSDDSGVKSQLYRSRNYKTGSRNAPNYYGFSADNNLRYQMSAPIKNVGSGFNVIGEKMGRIGDTLLAAGTFLGFKELNDVLIKTPGKAETQRYLLNTMQGKETVHTEGGSEATTLYKTLDKTTDQLPISMQNVVQPLYAFQAATGSTAQQINDIIPEFTNFGAQVLNMTGSEEQAETAMQKLSYAFQGQYAAVDQFGITEKSLADKGFKKGDTDVGKFMKAVTEIVGDAKGSMQNYEGLKALVGKDFSRAGKTLWNNGVGQTMNALVGGYHNIDSQLNGFISQLIVASGALMNFATTATTSFGSIANIIGTFGKVSSEFQAIRSNGGGIFSAFKGVLQSDKTGLYDNSYRGATEVLDNAKLETAVFEGSLQGTLQGINSSNASNILNGKPSSKTIDVDIDDNIRKSTTPKIPPVYDTTYKSAGGKSGIENAINNKKQKDRYLTGTYYPNKSIELFYKEKEKDNLQSNASRMFDQWDLAERQATANAKNGFLEFPNKKDRGLEDNAKNHKLLGKHLPFVNKAFGKLTGLLGFLTSPTGALLGLGTAAMAVSGWVNFASAHDDRVKNASTNLERAFGNLGNAAGDLVGDFFKNIGLSTQGGMQGLYEGTANALNNLAMVINDITGHSEEDEKFKSAQERDTKKKEEADRTGEGFLTLNEKEFANADYWYDPKTKQTKGVTDKDELKVEAMNNQRYWGHANELNAKFWDGIVGIFNGGKGAGFYQKAHGINVEQENLIKSGDEQRLHERLGPLNFVSTAKYGKINKEFAQAIGEWAPKLMPGALGWLSGALGNMLGGSKTSAQTQAEGRQKRDASERGEQGLTSAITGLTTAFNTHPLGGLLSSLTGGGQQSNQVQQQQSNPLAGLFGGGQQGQSPLGDGTQAGTDWGSQFMAGLTQSFTTQPLNIDQLFGGGESGNNMLMKGQEWGNSLTTGVNTSLSGATIDTSGIDSSLNGMESKFGEKGANSGNRYKNDFKTNVDGTSDIAQAEANDVVAALRSSIAGARQAGEAAGSAYHEGFEEKADRHSPGIAARMARAEANDLVRFLQEGVAPAGLAGARTALAYVNGVSALTGHTAKGVDVAESINSSLNSASDGNISLYDNSSDNGDNTSSNNKGVHIVNNFHIDKIDSKERVREIAETLVHIMTFNNETAGRNTNVGL